MVFLKFVGVSGLEPPASTSRTWRASQLRYTPNLAPRIWRGYTPEMGVSVRVIF